MVSYVLSRTNPFAFPQRNPGVDFSHPAANNLRISAFSNGLNFVSLFPFAKGTPTSVSSSGVDGVIGPYTKVAASTGGTSGTSFALQAATGINITLAAIVRTPVFSSSLFESIIAANRSGAAGADNILSVEQLSGSVGNIFATIGASNITSSFTILPSAPYFLAMSAYGSNSTGKTTLIATNLVTGQILIDTTETISSNANVNGTDTSIAVGNDTGSGGFNADAFSGQIAAVMASDVAMSPVQMLAWANDPWAFWYPRTDLILDSLAAATAIFVPGPRRRIIYNRKWF